MVNAAIAGTGYYLPDEIRDNKYFADGEPWFYFDRNGNSLRNRDGFKKAILTEEGILRRTGIRERRIARNQPLEELAARAGAAALDDAGMSAQDLYGILVATVTQTQQYPSAAVLVQKRIGATKVRETYDVGKACAGWPMALDQAASAIIRGRGPYLVIGAERLSGVTDYLGRDINATLFGDGAGAAVVVPEDTDRGILAYTTRSEPFDSRHEYITRDIRGLLRMQEGAKVLKNAVPSMAVVTQELIDTLGWSLDDIYLVPHQANKRITEGVIRKTGIDPSRVGDNIEWYGNMSAATCPILLAQMREQGAIGTGSKAIVVSFGSGLVTSGVAIQF